MLHESAKRAKGGRPRLHVLLLLGIEVQWPRSKITADGFLPKVLHADSYICSDMCPLHA
jgi:hypothetical protein